MSLRKLLAFMTLLLGTAAFLLGGCAAPQTTAGKAGTPEVANLEPVSTRELFMVKCSHCHETLVAYEIINDRQRWIRAVATMATKDLGWINPGDMKIIISYYQDHPRVLTELFDSKCGSCHQWGLLKEQEKSLSQWKTLINFMGKRSPGGLNNDEGEIIFFGLIR